MTGHTYPAKSCGNPDPHPQHVWVDDRGYACFGRTDTSASEHPADCRFCEAGEPQVHTYEPGHDGGVMTEEEETVEERVETLLSYYEAHGAQIIEHLPSFGEMWVEDVVKLMRGLLSDTSAFKVSP